MPRLSGKAAGPQKCPVAELPNEVLSHIFSFLPLDEAVLLSNPQPQAPQPQLPADRDVDEAESEETRHPQIIVLSWVSKQFRTVAHNHAFWQGGKLGFADFLWRLPLLLEDPHFADCLARKSSWVFTSDYEIGILNETVPSYARNAREITLGACAFRIQLQSIFVALPICPNVTKLTISAYHFGARDGPRSYLGAIPELFPGLKKLHISDSLNYIGNIHDLAGLTELVLLSYSGSNDLIAYKSCETLENLGLYAGNHSHRSSKRPVPRLDKFLNLQHMEIFPLNPYKKMLNSIRNGPISLEASVQDYRWWPDRFDHDLFSPPCLQNIQELKLSNMRWDYELGRAHFESIIKQITSLRFLRKVEFTMASFDAAWLRYFAGLRELQSLIWGVAKMYLGTQLAEEGEQFAVAFGENLIRTLKEVFEEGRDFQERPKVVIRISDDKEICEELHNTEWIY